MDIKKAITFRASSLGDAMLAKHLLENVHAQYPAARCGLVVAGRATMIKELLAAYPWITVVEANRKSLRSLWYLWREWRDSDLVVTPGVKPGGQFGIGSKIAARLLARRGALVGFTDAFPFNTYVYDTVLPYDAVKAPRLLEQDALRAAGIAVTIPDLSLSYVAKPEILVSLGLQNKKYVVVHLFAGADSRGMSQQKRQELVDMLAQQYPDTPLVFTGTAREREAIERLTLPPQAVIAAGRGGVEELATLIVHSAVMLSVGTGPSHMASHLKHPLVVLVVCNGRHWCGTEQFGEESRAYTHVYSCVECCGTSHNPTEATSPCIEGISTAAVVSDVGRYLS